MPKTYHITTYGCAMNHSDSERIAALLERLGYLSAPARQKADLAVINMCSIRQAAVDRVFGLTQKRIKGQKTILTGCVAKRDIEKFSKLFDYILPIKSLPNWEKLLQHKQVMGFANKKRMTENKDLNINYLKIKPKNSSQFSASIPVSYGCNNFCTFCVVPYTRGPLVCRASQEIIKETKRAINSGAKEIWLLGQNVNDYRCPKTKCDFADLIKKINDLPKNFWIRFTSPHPAQITDRFIQTLAQCQKVTPYINLPMQSGDDTILRKMNRPYSIKKYREIVKKLRAAFKKYRSGLEAELAISTDVIVGFPNETKKQFMHTAANFEHLGFDMAFLAEYSPRPHTPAAKQDNIPNDEKKRRYRILNQILGQTALAKNRKYKNKIAATLVSSQIEKNRRQFCFGKTRSNKTVGFIVPEKISNLSGHFVNVKIKKISPWGLYGEFVSLI